MKTFIHVMMNSDKFVIAKNKKIGHEGGCRECDAWNECDDDKVICPGVGYHLKIREKK